jgi:NADH-quinone oxidoreductase subunit N
MQNITSSLINFIPEIILFIMSMVILLIGTFERLKKYVFHLTILSVFLASLISVNYLSTDSLLLFDSAIIKNNITEFFKYICYFIFLIQIIISKDYLKQKNLISGEFYSLLIFALLGCFIIISANNLIVLFLGIELSSLSLYSLIALNKSSFLSSEAAIKYFVLSIIASAIILFGFSYLYGISNSIIILDIATYANNNEISNLYLFSYVFIFIGVAFKFAVAPFHMWLPDVYEGAPLPITNFIASIPKIAFFVFAYRFLYDNPIINDENFSKLILFLGMFSIFIGNLFALAQKKIMRMLAYSGVANAGFIFLALFSAQENNFSIAAFYVASYSITTVSAISIMTFLSSNKFDLIYISDLKGMASKSGYLAILLMITLLSMAGIPLTIGFYAKYLVLDALVDRNLILIAVIVVLMTVVGLYYYLRIIWFMFFESGLNSLLNTSGKFSITILSIIPASILLIFLFPDLVFKYIFDILT